MNGAHGRPTAAELLAAECEAAVSGALPTLLSLQVSAQGADTRLVGLL